MHEHTHTLARSLSLAYLHNRAVVRVCLLEERGSEAEDVERAAPAGGTAAIPGSPASRPIILINLSECW